MENREHRADTGAKGREQQTTRHSQTDVPESRNHFFLQHDPLASALFRLGDSSGSGLRPTILSRVAASNPLAVARLVLRLQRQQGNRCVQRNLDSVRLDAEKTGVSPQVEEGREEEEKGLSKSEKVQTQLTVGSPEDEYEKEAERVSEQVYAFQESGVLKGLNQSLDSLDYLSGILGMDLVRRSGSSSVSETARRLCVFTNPDAQSPGNRSVSPSVEGRILNSRGRGSGLPSAIQGLMSLQTGYDFGNVKVKTDSEAADLNRQLNSRAFTLGSDIWLGQNESVNDTKLMAHELTHVVQQGAATKVNSKKLPERFGIKADSGVLDYVRAIAQGAHYDPALFRKEIARFQKQNVTTRISALQKQLLEPTNSMDIRQKSDSKTLRACASCTNCAPNTARPVNFRQTAGRDSGGGRLHFEYAWDSSTGNLADLSNVEVGEHVAYAPFSSPPFVRWSNPTIIWLPGTRGRFSDNHSVGVIKPYSVATKTATQYYRYRRSGGTATNLMGPIAIIRGITSKPAGQFKYRITKSGVSAQVDPLP